VPPCHRFPSPSTVVDRKQPLYGFCPPCYYHRPLIPPIGIHLIVTPPGELIGMEDDDHDCSLLDFFDLICHCSFLGRACTVLFWSSERATEQSKIVYRLFFVLFFCMGAGAYAPGAVHLLGLLVHCVPIIQGDGTPPTGEEGCVCVWVVVASWLVGIGWIGGVVE
jgi:hypothetical protein